MNFYIFNNGIMTESAMSGCEQRVLNWLPIFSKQAKVLNVITSKQGRARFDKFKVIETTGFSLKGSLGLFISYLVRAIKGCTAVKAISLKPEDKNIIYSASDLIADFFPALWLKRKYKNAFFVVGLHLIAPCPCKGFKKYYQKGFSWPTLSGIYYFISQSLILFLAKRCVSLVLVSNQRDREILLKKGFKPENVLVTHGAVDIKEASEAKCEQIVYDACYVGRFHAQKGFDDLINIWAKTIEVLPDAKLAIIGYDRNLEKVKEKVKSAGLDRNVIFLGFIGGADKYKLIKASKLSLVPSYYESFGMVILEALACSVPVVAYKLPVYKEIYTKGVKMADIGDQDQFAKMVVFLLQNDQERQELGQEGRSLSETFSWQITAEDILKRLTNY